MGHLKFRRVDFRTGGVLEHIKARYEDIVAVLGEPFEGDGGKTQAEFRGWSSRGRVALWDYKESIQPELVTTWSLWWDSPLAHTSFMAQLEEARQKRLAKEVGWQTGSNV